MYRGHAKNDATRRSLFDSPLSPRKRQKVGNNNAAGETKTPSSSIACTHSATYGNCVDVSSRYEKIARIGQGTYGIVYKARDLQTNRLVALKRCLPHHEESDGFPITTLREIQSLRMCMSHPHIIKLETVGVSQKGVFLVFEYCEHDLADLIDNYYQKHGKSPFSFGGVKTLMMQLLQALAHLHAHHLIHRDVKVSNLLYTSRGTLKLADFGLSRPFSDNGIMGINGTAITLTPKVASLWYRPPELLIGNIASSTSSIAAPNMLLQQQLLQQLQQPPPPPQSINYTQAIDLWATGCVMAELIAGKPLLNGRTELEQLSKMIEYLGMPSASDLMMNNTDFQLQLSAIQLSTTASVINGGQHRSTMRILDEYSHLTPSGLSLLLSFLTYNPQQRSTAPQALQSAFFVENPLPLSADQMPRFPNYVTQQKKPKK